MSTQQEPAYERRIQNRKKLIRNGCLVTLLVMLGILAAILYPFYRVALDEAQCMARWSDHGVNAQIIGSALVTYRDHHDGTLPQADNWATALQPMVDHIFDVRYQIDFKRAKQYKLDGIEAAPAKKSHYDIVKWSRDPFAMNRALNGVNIKKIKHPEQTVVFFETTERKPNPSGDQSIQLPPYGVRKWSTYVMADGKVKVTAHAEDGSGRLVDWVGRPVTIRWKP
ncbi:MAG: hypothetical protein ACYC1M_18770 [Armatimonadota bacterium]